MTKKRKFDWRVLQMDFKFIGNALYKDMRQLSEWSFYYYSTYLSYAYNIYTYIMYMHMYALLMYV